MKEKNPNSSTIPFVITHPILIINTLIRQTMVKIEHEAPPHGISIEDFADMPIIEAAKTIQKANNTPNIIWSKSDQQRMANGELPKNPPQHLNL